MKGFWLKKAIGMVVCAALAIVALGFVIMTLWNHILVTVLSVKAITYTQALGIFVLSKLLFGGFRGKGCGCGNSCGLRGKGREMKEKWQNMMPEERETFKQNWRSRCRTWGKEAE